jgi:hypothetical protein
MGLAPPPRPSRRRQPVGCPRGTSRSSRSPVRRGCQGITSLRPRSCFSFRVWPSAAAARLLLGACPRSASPEVCGSFSTCLTSSPRSMTRVCLARYVPPPGFPTLLTACSSTTLPALFHAGALMEFHPSERFPRPEPHRLSTARCPPAVAARIARWRARGLAHRQRRGRHAAPRSGSRPVA